MTTEQLQFDFEDPFEVDSEELLKEMLLYGPKPTEELVPAGSLCDRDDDEPDDWVGSAR